ncbi:MAG: hypothetical protein FJ027_02225 [Candidatus Rokubacteria bacterium]|nr:hypothetical protein [Candidatus Rokubacteria bacterium]
MWALRHPAAAARLPFHHGWLESRAVAAACLAALVTSSVGLVPAEVAAVIGVATLHGGLLAAALVWGGIPVREAVPVIALLALARTAVALHPVGAVLYLAVPLWLVVLAANGRLSRLGLAPPWRWGGVVIGTLAGIALALHLIACASRTLGYGVRVDAATVLPALAYDVGANVLSAELFFRGALFQHLWRRWTFGVALALAAGAAALRYVLDPFVATIELRVGAAVYMGLLAILNGTLLRWSGSLLPGIAAATMFFACYRLLASG